MLIEKVVVLSSFEIWCIQEPISPTLGLTRKQLVFPVKHTGVFQQSSINNQTYKIKMDKFKPVIFYVTP